MKIYKVCHSAYLSLAGKEQFTAPDFVNDVRVFTSKRKALNYAILSVGNYRDVIGYDAREIPSVYLRAWVLALGSMYRVIQVIEDETK